MKIVQHGKKRKAISPVLATVILIAITLIAAIAVAGFVFGLFGSFTSTPQLQATNVVCGTTGTAAAVTCTFSLTNSGSGTAGFPGSACSVQIAGSPSAGQVEVQATGHALVPSVPGNTGPLADQCTTTGTYANAGVAGSTATGYIVTANGNIPYSGVWA